MSAAISDAAHPAGGRSPGTPLLALASGGLFGVLQTLVAERCGLLRFAATRTGGLGAELATLTWLSAISVVVGVLVARRFGRPARGRGTGLITLGAAAFGGLFAVPLTSSSVAWAAVYGGDVPASRAAAQVVIGIALGILAGLFAQRYRPVAVGLLVGSAVVWAVALLSALLGADNTPVLGHPDLSAGSTVLSQRVGALAVALLLGAAFGLGARSRPVESRVVAAIAGPALVAVTYLTTVPITGGDWLWSPLPAALLAVPCAALGAVLAARTARSLRA